VISSMREYFRSLKFILVIIIVAFIATSVVYFGTSALSGGSNKPNVVATVNGEEIPAERYRRAQQSLVAAYERMSKQRMTPELAERLGLNQQVMNDLVSDAVIVQGAEREGVRVTDDELRLRIQEMREFQEDGHFSRDRYVRVLRQVRLEPGEFEAEMRRQLVRQKIESLVRDGIKISDAEVTEAYNSRNERVRAAYASIDVQPFMAGVTVADADVEPYVKAHQAQFTRPERRRLQYVVASPSAYAQPVTDQEVEAYYKEHAGEFEQPRRVHVAHVLVRVPQVGGSEAENKAKAKIEAVIKRVQGGEDFAKLAKEVSEDTSNAPQGGDLGFVGPGELVPQFEQAAFALKKGEVSAAPVRTPFGYHAIKVLDIREAAKKPLKEAAGQIRDKLTAERSDRAARTKAEEAKAALIGAKDFAAQAKALGLDARDGTVGKGESLEAFGREPQLDEAVFSLAVGGVSAPIKTRSGYVLVKVVGQIPAGVPPLAEIRSQVVDAIKRERAEAQAIERARAFIASLAKGGEFSATAKAAGLPVAELPFFSRAEPPKDRGLVPNGVFLAAFQTPAGQIAEPVRGGNGVYVVKVLERLPADAQGLEKQRGDLEKQLLDQKRNQVWDGWIRAHRATTKVEVAGQPVPPGR
jgi:peptidyl-prolyl cis-trans isomerase D